MTRLSSPNDSHAALLIGCGLAVCWWRARANRPAGLSVPKDRLNLGRVFDSDAFEHVLPVTNPFSDPVTVTHYQQTCDCLKIEPELPVVIRPGETVPLRLVLSFAEQAAVTIETDDHVEFGVTYTPGEQRPGRSRTEIWPIRFRVGPSLRLRPNRVVLGDRSVRQPHIGAVVRMEAADEVIGFDFDGPRTWDTELLPAGGANAYNLSLRYTGPVRAGRIADTMRIIPLARGTPPRRLPAWPLPITGDLVPDIGTAPGELHVGKRPVGSTVEEAVVLRSLTGRAVRVVSARSDADALSVRKIADATFALRLTVARPGDHGMTAGFVVEDDGGTRG